MVVTIWNSSAWRECRNLMEICRGGLACLLLSFISVRVLVFFYECDYRPCFVFAVRRGIQTFGPVKCIYIYVCWCVGVLGVLVYCWVLNIRFSGLNTGGFTVKLNSTTSPPRTYSTFTTTTRTISPHHHITTSPHHRVFSLVSPPPPYPPSPLPPESYFIQKFQVLAPCLFYTNKIT